MITVEIRLLGMRREWVDEAKRVLEGFVNGLPDSNGITQKVDFRVTSPGRGSEFLAYGHMTMGIPAGSPTHSRTGIPLPYPKREEDRP